ncbi:MAG: UvrD-helicase domain-containing protein [Candidatus Nealsonbacteria bacterium]|nr:UvrD-helicase domain-containing protein [Candidatus Nealsonbacteria bacterium]
MKKLNEEQKEAVVHEAGPLLIVAGAGTGKTTVITQRIAYLIEKELAKPEEILAVTFTEKAAGEMEERVDTLLPYGYVDLWISTFHSFCERVLRDHALDIGLPADFKVLDPTAGWLLVRQNLDKFELDYYKPLGNPTKFIQTLISHFSHCKDQEVYPEDYLEYSERLKTRDDSPENQETERIKEVANAFHAYQKLLLENSYLDFGDLINYCLKLFKKRPLILEKYREKFKYILVDEFQDTNWSQYELIKVLAFPKNNLTVCADDDQAIYCWRGASFSNIILFKKDFPKAKQISLVKNYRSAQNILDLAYRFIKANDPDRLEYVNKINKKLISMMDKPTSAKASADAKALADKSARQGGIIEHISAKNLDEEVGKTIKKILEILKRDKEVNYNDIAILVRANNTANVFTKALERAGLPYQFLASKGLYSKPIILDVISYFKLLDNYHESPSVYRILNLLFLEIPYQDIINIIQYSHRKTKSLFEAMEELALIPGISERAQEKIPFILSLIKKHSALSREKIVSEIFLAFLGDSGYLKYLASKDDKEQIDVLNQFYKRIKSFEESAMEPSLKNFMEEIVFEIESGEEGKLEFDPEQGPDMIKVMTIHGAKGLEFKYVFLVNMVDKRFPTIERKDLIELPEELIKDIKPKGDVHLQEERRICYVAMTRAKKELYFTSAEDYGLARKKRLSRFLIEMGYKDSLETKNLKSKNGLPEPAVKKPETKSQKESEYLPEHFSFSQLAAFEKCPLQYKFNFILKIPIKGKAVFSFGKTMHNTFYSFLKAASESSKNNQSDLFGFPDKKTKTAKKDSAFQLEDLLLIFEKNWIGEWYETKSQKEGYYKLGKKIVKDFYQEFIKNPPKVLKINNSFALEMPFNLKIGKNTLFGVIDRIDEREGGVAIIDYKTGSSKEKLKPEDKEQLLIYQIAIEEVFKLKPKELIYDYLNDGKKASFLGSAEETENLKEKIKREIEEIKKSNFKPTPGHQCGFCDFKDICDFAQRQ